MKLPLTALLAMAAFSPLPARAQVVDVPRMDKVVIDGKAADWGAGGYRMDVIEPMGGPDQRPQGQRVQVRLGWDDRGLLMLVTVWDDKWVENPLPDRLHEGDGVEAFVYAQDKGYCHWAFSPGMDPRQPELRWQVFDHRTDAAVRARPARPTAARTRNGNECTVEILLPLAAMGITPAEGVQTQLQFWVADHDGRADDIRHAWRRHFALRLSRTASPPQRFLYRTGFNAKAMLANVIVEGGPASVGKTASLTDGPRTLYRTTFTADASGGATAELFVPERPAGAPLYGELAVVADGETIARLAAPDPDKGKAEGFLFAAVAARPGSVFEGPTLPTVDFADPAQAVKAIGPYKLKTTYYDRDFQPVTKADRPGRYGAVMEVTAADGRTCRRFLTLVRQGGPLPTDPSDRQWWVDFKRKLYGWDKRWPGPFVCPRGKEGPPAPVVREGTAAQAGMKDDAAAKIDAVLAQWAADSDEPFAACVVRHGVVVLHKAYGVKEDGRPATVDDGRFLASLTKFLSSVLMMTFVDQGLVDLNAPVADYLPAFRGVRSNRPLTVRDLYTHTSGFAWHWGGGQDDLEERLAFYVPHVRVGEQFVYNSTGFDLGTKVMEAVSGECLPNLYQHHVLDPLGCRGPTLHDGGAGGWSVPMDLARIGQMLLNKGAYGDKRFMSERTCALLLPAPGQGYGLGTMWMADGLGKGTYAHGAKSMAILRIDPANDLVVAMTRNRPGRNYTTYQPKFFAAIIDGLKR